MINANGIKQWIQILQFSRFCYRTESKLTFFAGQSLVEYRKWSFIR